MTIALGVVLVVLAIAFVLLPLFRTPRSESLDHLDPALIRAGLYRQIIDAELDARLGKLESTEFRELRARLLQEAAALIVASDGGPQTDGDAQAQVEQEVAAARAAIQRNPSMRGVSA
jgi:hypothetical protein